VKGEDVWLLTLNFLSPIQISIKLNLNAGFFVIAPDKAGLDESQVLVFNTCNLGLFDMFIHL
jgi:hypothetical protein